MNIRLKQLQVDKDKQFEIELMKFYTTNLNQRVYHVKKSPNNIR